MFLFRSLSAKMNTMSVTMGTLALLFTLTLSAAELGTFFRNFFESQGVPDFEVSVYLDAKYNDFEQYHNYLEENYGISQEKIYKTYESPGTVYGELQDTPFAGTYMDFDPVMRYSDYAQLREMLGYEPVKLDKGKYIVQGMPGIRDYLEGRPVKKEFEKMTLEYGGTYTEKLGVTEGLNGAYYFLVVPDEVAQTLTPYRSIYVADTKKSTVESTYLDICGFVDPTMDGVAFGNVYVRGTVLAENRSLFTIMVFALFYLGLIFICVAATILAVQQLSDASKFRYRYKILSNLGMQHKRVERLILKQLVIYFVFPLLLPLPISIFITACINQILSAYVNASVMIQSILAALGMFGIVYILYFSATYVGYRKFGTEDF